MVEKIEKFVYGDDDDEGLFSRIRNGYVELTAEEEKVLLDFSLEVAQKVRNKESPVRELLLCMDIIYIFMWHPGLMETATMMYDNIAFSSPY